jgi:hypothetical protein
VVIASPAAKEGRRCIRRGKAIDRRGRARQRASWVLPNIPTLGDSLPGYEAKVFYGVGAPKKTPAEIVEKLNKEINAALADPKLKARGLPTWASQWFPARLPTSASSSPMTRRSGPK